MNIKGASRAGGQELAAHLGNAEKNEPTRPDEVRQQGLVEGGPDYVSATTAAAINAAMLNQDKQAPSEAKEIPVSAVADRAPSQIEARDQVTIENEQTKEKRIAEFAERFGNTPSTQSREREQEQER